MGISRGGEFLSEISSKSNQVVPELVETHPGNQPHNTPEISRKKVFFMESRSRTL